MLLLGNGVVVWGLVVASLSCWRTDLLLDTYAKVWSTLMAVAQWPFANRVRVQRLHFRCCY